MKKRIIAVLVCVICLSTLCLVLIGCSDDTSGEIKEGSRKSGVEIISIDFALDAVKYLGVGATIKVKNKSSESRYVYFEVNFYYDGDLIDGDMTESETLAGGDEYSFVANVELRMSAFTLEPSKYSYKITEFNVS